MDKARPLISVIVPIFNSAAYLCSCFESILGQSEQNIELIAVDDCSTDNSLDVCKQFSERDSRVTVVANEKNIGQGLSRNKGIEISSGKFITFVDSDDTIDSRMYSTLLAAAETCDAQVARCGFRRVTAHDVSALEMNDDVPTRCLSGLELKRYLDGYYGMLPSESLSDAPSASPCTALYDGDIVRQRGIRFPSERLVRSEDLFFNIEASTCADRLALVDAPLYDYLVRPGSTTRTFSSPIGKCELLSKLAPEGDDYSLRLTRSYLTAIKEASIQLALSKQPLAQSVREVSNLEQRLCIKERLSSYPVDELPGRERVFAHAARLGLTLPEVLMGRIDVVRRVL